MEERKVITAPQLDRLLRYFDRDHMNPSVPTRKIAAAMEPLFAALSDLVPLKKNDEAKAIWLEVPRGTINDYESFENMLEWGEVESYAEYENMWHEDYPTETCWYRLVVVESFNRDGNLSFRAVAFGNKTVISADMNEEPNEDEFYRAEDQAVELCGILTILAEDAMEKVRNGTYNDRVNTSLPYPFRTGVVKRYVVWEKEPEWKDHSLEGLTPETLTAFKDLMASGMNDEMKIGRLDSMTANDFFRACAIGYKACGYKGTELSPAKQYYLHADGRDEGLSGKGYGLNAGSGIDFDDPAAWEEWYFDTKRGGGHPWEVVRGGNSTHVDLYVAHDRNNIDWKVRAGKISKEEAEAHSRGFYYIVRGLHRAVEAVNFYTALSAANLPVILSDAEEILARFEMTDYIGIVPHNVIPKYCEGMFPTEYGRVVDFMHVYEEEIEEFGDQIIWLPMEQAEVKQESGK
ncbi:MAG: hypothetical protein II969_08375 [Anaerolineaceae bacterium]|nr:hypothetical protein [Anaerolineaceae bacterium]